MRICGIDASTKKTGFSIVEDYNLKYHDLIDCEKIKDREKRIKEMCIAIIEHLNYLDPDIVYIEDSWNAANVDVTKLLTRIMGVVYFWCIENEKDYHAILPTSWRRIVGFDQAKKKRTELKQMSVDYIKNKFGIEVNDDVADSICIAIAGQKNEMI